MRDHEDLTAFEVLILALLLDDDTSAEKVTTQESEASIPPGEKHRARD
jgi:hypothetical protein